MYIYIYIYIIPLCTPNKFIETAMYTFRSQYRYVHFSAHNTAMYITHFQKPLSKAFYVLNTISMF